MIEIFNSTHGIIISWFLILEQYKRAGYKQTREAHRGMRQVKKVVKTYTFGIREPGSLFMKRYSTDITLLYYAYPIEKMAVSNVTVVQEVAGDLRTGDSLIERLGGERERLGGGVI